MVNSTWKTRSSSPRFDPPLLVRGGGRGAPFFREGGKCVANRGSFSNKLFADLFYAGLLNTSVLFARRISDGKFEIKREESSNIVQRDFFSLTR